MDVIFKSVQVLTWLYIIPFLIKDSIELIVLLKTHFSKPLYLMKKSSLLLAYSLLILFLSSFTIHPLEDSKVKISIKGVDHAIKDGLKPSEFGELKIESTSQDMKIESMEITLARGNRAVEVSQVIGNSFNLRRYVNRARSGDRIVIEVKKMNSEDEPLSSDNNYIVAIKVN